MTAARARPRLAADERRAIGAALAHAARHDTMVHAMLVTHLLEGNTSDLAELRRAVSRRDWQAVHRSVHRIKGSAALARCATLVAAGKSIESAAGHGNAAVVNILLPRYTAIVEEFNATLAALSPAAGNLSANKCANRSAPSHIQHI